jgi:AbrB family looped-hinge helix DNA binding protein
MIDRENVEPRNAMSVVTVSSKYQIVIPKEVRESLGIRPGQKLRVFRFGDLVTVVPVRPIRSIKGKLPGIDTDVPRDPDRF